jgi:hypothetical protein
MNKKNKEFYPLSYTLAIENKSFVKGMRMVERCDVEINENKRTTNVQMHWKPISKII